MNDDPPGGNLALATEIVAAYVANHAVAPADLPDLITGVLRALNDAGRVEEAAPERPEPAVPVRKSWAGLHRLPRGRQKLKLLKRYLQKRYGMTPAEYRSGGACRATTRWWRPPTPSAARRWPGSSAWAASRRRRAGAVPQPEPGARVGRRAREAAHGRPQEAAA
jgi:hypothetical protein